jgi:hypothetical protein
MMGDQEGDAHGLPKIGGGQAVFEIGDGGRHNSGLKPR